MLKSKITLFGVVTFILLMLLINVTALTASIGNSRMILHPNVNEEVERSILVKNVNDVPIDISMFSSGDLENNVKIFGENFSLAAGDEKKVVFTIFADKPGTFDTKVNIKFTGPDGNGVGLSSTILIITNGTMYTDNEDDTDTSTDDDSDNDDSDTDADDDTDNDNIDFNTNSTNINSNATKTNSTDSADDNLIDKTASKLSIPPALFLLFSTTLLLLVFLVLVVYVKKLNSKKEARRNGANK